MSGWVDGCIVGNVLLGGNENEWLERWVVRWAARWMDLCMGEWIDE